MNKELFFNWAVVIFIGVGFLLFVLKLRSSDIYIVTNNLPINAIFNGESSPNVIYTATLEKSIRHQIRDINEISDSTSWAYCLNFVKEKDKTYNVIRQLIDQLQVRNLYFSEHNNQAKLSLELVATPPILFSYYFTKAGDSYSFDSIVGLDKIAHHFIKLNQLAPLSSSSNN